MSSWPDEQSRRCNHDCRLTRVSVICELELRKDQLTNREAMVTLQGKYKSSIQRKATVQVAVSC